MMETGIMDMKGKEKEGWMTWPVLEMQYLLPFSFPISPKNVQPVENESIWTTNRSIYKVFEKGGKNLVGKAWEKRRRVGPIVYA